jgi:3-phosphoglycerate kinase
LHEFPLDVDQRHIAKPEYQQYFDNKFLAVLGGNCKNTQDIVDKILLANSLLEHATQIFLVGEMGLVAMHALGFSCGKIERFMDNKYLTREFDEVK